MTLRDWLEILVVPLALVSIGFLFTAQQDQRQQQIENQRAASDRRIAQQGAQNEALRAYLNQMSKLMLNRDLRSSEVGSEVRTLARARTLTVLRGLGPSDKADVVTFLWEAELISDDPTANTNVLSLFGADLSGAYLEGALLYSVDFAGADLSDANISNAVLNDASFDLTDLSNANLSGSALRGAYAGRANLKGANLSGAYLDGAIFDENSTNLSGADLSGADLSGAKGLTRKLLSACASLKGATMPNGQKYEDWIKDREDGKNE